MGQILVLPVTRAQSRGSLGRVCDISNAPISEHLQPTRLSLHVLFLNHFSQLC